MNLPRLLVIICGLYTGVSGIDYLYDHVYNTLRSVDYALTTPQTSAQKPVNVTLDLAIHRVVNMDTENQELVMDGVLRMRWADFRLAWGPWVANGVNNLVWPHLDRIWTPDVIVLNGFGSQFDTSPEASALRLDDMGNVTWDRPLRVRVPCDVSRGSGFCSVRLGSWSHGTESVLVQSGGQGVDVTGLWSHSRHAVTSAGVRVTETERCCPQGRFQALDYVLNVVNN